MYAFIGDLHLGVKLPNEDYIKSLELFLKTIQQHKEPCHAIFIVGDLFDHRLTIEESQFASRFIVQLVCNHCGRNGVTNIPVYFIHGTYSHDLNQYEIYLPLLKQIDNVNVFYCKQHGEFELRNGLRVLAIPHENGDIDYSKAFSKSYDMIVGHGVIVQGTRNPCKANGGIIHSADQLGKISKLCVFGHYHGYTNFGNGVYYTGPWLRWQYGEDEQRVFFFCDDKLKVETVVNPFALEYKTVMIANPEELREFIATDIQTPHRFIINANKDDINIYRGIILAEKQNVNVKFQLTTDEEEPVVEEEIVENVDHSIHPIPALVSYIKDKYGVDATDKLTEYETQINKETKE